jgi:GTP cyclohydrolase II
MNNGDIIIVDKVMGVPLTNEVGKFFLGAYKVISNVNNWGEEIIILYYGNLSDIKNIRINSACYSSDLFHCTRCDCHDQLEDAMKYFANEGNGMIIYFLNHDGRGCGTVNKLKSLLLMDEKKISTKEAFEHMNLPTDNRDYSIAVRILNDLNINNINLLTNNPEKVEFLRKKGITVEKRIPVICVRKETLPYLRTKRKDFNHFIEV